MKFTLRYNYMFNGPQHLPWHLCAEAGIRISDWVAMKTYCVELWGPPGTHWLMRGSIWYFQHEADAIQVMLTFS